MYLWIHISRHSPWPKESSYLKNWTCTARSRVFFSSCYHFLNNTAQQLCIQHSYYRYCEESRWYTWGYMESIRKLQYHFLWDICRFECLWGPTVSPKRRLKWWVCVALSWVSGFQVCYPISWQTLPLPSACCQLLPSPFPTGCYITLCSFRYHFPLMPGLPHNKDTPSHPARPSSTSCANSLLNPLLWIPLARWSWPLVCALPESLGWA